MGIAPPTVPADRLESEGWRVADRAEGTAFDVGVVAVGTHAVVYEDARLREAIRAETGIDGTWRFFLASRVSFAGPVPNSRLLGRFVADRAHEGFRDALLERGFSNLRTTEQRRISFDEADGTPAGIGVDETVGADDGDGSEPAEPVGYDADCVLDAVRLRTRALAAVRGTDDGRLLVGGAYPTDVREAPDPEVRERLREHVDPERFEADLLALIRATG
ncbi:hypothetical protein [Halorarum salinum]|uniref:Uncharacterized protein n=1 Tax=Halorarum salinum TaxID=2743089 RepID=A0A7D5QGI1_9EURY|nr:hypothetical protein [Halobaculum salinum]QLG62082.1 hypothetical protein HUG12_10220 [Halobaculum salinum]